MARAAESLFIKQPSKTAPTTNLEGHPAFERPPKEQLLQTLLTNTLAGTFYETKGALIDDTERVHTEALADPAFMEKALGYARNKGFMRTQPVYGLARLSAIQDSGPFERAFPTVIKTPNDLVDFASIIKTLRGGEGGRRIKRVAGNWLRDNLSEYWAIKYGSENKGYSLRDLFRAYHPMGNGSALINYVLRKGDGAGLPQIEAFERLKRATTDEEKVAAITAGRLPHEVATTFAGGSRKIWEAIVPNMPPFALLRNLATLERHGALDAARERIVAVFNDPIQIARSKIFPFRFLEASKHVQAAWAQDACRQALELSFGNAGQIEGVTAVAVDVSVSMSHYLDMALILGISTVRRAKALLFAFADRIGEFQVSKVDSVLTQAGYLTRTAGQVVGGGTNTAAVAQMLNDSRGKVDNLILITDEQQNAGNPFMNGIAEYRRRRNDKLKVFVLNVAPYTKNSLLDTSHPGNFYVYGMTEAALNFIAYASRGWGKFVEHVEKGGEAHGQEEEGQRQGVLR